MRVAGPLRERDLGDETRLDPVCVASEPTRRTRRERTVRRLDLFEPRAQIPRDADAETGPDLAGEDESIPVVVPNEERADALARSLRIGEAADDEFLPLDALRLHPAAAFPGLIRLVAPLRHDALEPETAGVLEGGASASLDVAGVTNPAAGAFSDHARERGFPRVERLRHEIAAVEVQQIEDEVDEALPRAAAERILQRLKTRAPVRQHHADFAVEQRALDAERGGGLRDFRELRRPVVPVAADEGCAPALDGAADAVAVVFQFVEPLGTVGRLLDQLCELRPIVHARPRIFANHQRSPTKRKRGSLKNSGGLPSKPWPMN